MSKFIEFIKALAPKSQKELDDAYLAQAADIDELELRIGDLQGRTRPGARGLAFHFSA